MIRLPCSCSAPAALLLAACALPASAQTVEEDGPEAPQPASEEGDITVTGDRRPPRSAVTRQAETITPREGNPRRNPLARFEKPVCPGVMGMPEDWAEQLVGRIRDVAELAGMTLAEENSCNANVIIAFVPDADEGVAQLRRALPVFFSSLSRRDMRDLAEATGPVRVITLSSERTRDGAEVPPRRGASAPPTVNIPLAFSRIYLTTREDIEAVALLFEVDAVDGMSIVQLADYAAMRVFAETRPPPADVLAMDTILTLFGEPDSAPQSLTEFDLAYLRSLYDGIANMPATTRILGLNRQLRRMDEEEPEIERPQAQ